MFSTPHDERRSFAFFLLLLFMTAPLISYGQYSPSLLGALAIMWGVFGFFRLLYVTSFLDMRASQILALPSQLLFGLGNSQSSKTISILARLASPDVMLFISGGVYLMFWVLFCSVYPADISIITEFNLKQNALLELPISSRLNVHVLAVSLSFYTILGIVILSALTYSQSRTNVRWAFYTILPVFITGVLVIIFMVPLTSVLLWPDLNILKGGGLGQGSVLQVLSPEVMERSATGLTYRFVEGGLVWAYGAYLLAFPAIVLMLRALFNKRRTSFKYVIGLFVLTSLILIDMFWLSSIYSKGLLVFGAAIIALCWGAAGRRA